MYEIPNEEAIGREVRKISCSSANGQMVIVFDDDTFTTFGMLESTTTRFNLRRHAAQKS